MDKKISLFNWSGGKDSCLALHHILAADTFEVRCLLTTVNEAFNRVSMHGVREALLIAQAESIGIPLYQVRLSEAPTMEAYEESMHKHLDALRSKGVEYSIFGDIFLEDLRTYREQKLAQIGLKAIFPLWKRDTKELISEFISLGYRTIVVCAQKGLEDFCGRVIDAHFIADLPVGIDPCGENGEFHTFVFDGPIFKSPIQFSLGEKVYKEFPKPNGEEGEASGYWYIDLLP
ncbi:diphthine--ammonia ligase [Pedobacter gandavensis]|uniref:Dph6-related ATP pyrophosphatase n=1 Tax=Pedobacter TaxID=84567 RepID=UPI001C99E660|nr:MULTISPECIES: diphthine--ammonia ligase [Pedobacter]WGQ09300.1 diphthine--ammonia ligase [Pedobacter gandavensis]